MLSPVQQRLDDFRQQARVQAGSLIVSVFGDAVVPRGGRIWLGSLIRLLEPLELSERLIRTSVFRLTKEAWLLAKPFGRRTDYLFTPSGQRRFEEASARIYASSARQWDCRWRLIVTVGALATKDRDRLRRALFWQGFGALGNDCFVHPGADLSTAFDALIADGLAHLQGQLKPLVAAAVQLGDSVSDQQMVRSAWNLDDLANVYAGFTARYQPILEQLRETPDELDDESAFLLRTLLIHDYRRLLLRDPALPDVLLPPAWPGRHARVLCKEIYRRVLGGSERHLHAHLRLADGSTPDASPALHERFRDADPLADPLA